MRSIEHFFCITHYMTGHVAMVEPWEALSLRYNL